jgi:hypothetical protein
MDEIGSQLSSSAPSTDEDTTTAEAPTSSLLNEQGAVVGAGAQNTAHSPDIKVSFALYALTYKFEDSVMPTRSQDYHDLTNSTQSVMKNFMARTFKEYPLSILVDFQTEFVRTGVSSGSHIFVVFQSTAVFDYGSFVIPEASQVEGTLREALDRDMELWLEYISALQELDPDNAFSSVIDVVYSTDLPPEPTGGSQSASSSSSSSSGTAIGAAAAGVAVVLIAVFVIKRRRDSPVLEDKVRQPQKNYRSRFFNNGNSTATVAETTAFDTSSKAIGRGSTNSPNEDLLADAEERGTLSNTTAASYDDSEERNESRQSLTGEVPARAYSDWDEYRTYSFNGKEAPEDEKDDYSEFSVDAIASQFHSEESAESTSVVAESTQRFKRWQPWRKQSSTRSEWESDRDESSLHLRSNTQALNSLTGTGNSQEPSVASDTKKDALDRQMHELNCLTRSQEQSKRQEKVDFARKKADLEAWLRKEQAIHSEEEDRLANERLQAELAKIKAEEAARTAEDLRLKEERRFAAEKESFEARLKLQEKARKIEEQKLRRSRANFEALILQEKHERLILEQRLAEEEKAADEALKAAEQKARRAELRIAEETLKLNAAKEALEIRQQKQAEAECGLFLKEEEEYLKRIRAEELARAENIKAGKEVALAVDIRKLQQRKFEEKQKALEALRVKEVSSGARSPFEIPSQTDDKGIDVRASLLETAENATDSERLALALRLAQSWDSPSVLADISQSDIGMRLAQSWDSSTIQEFQDGVKDQSQPKHHSTRNCSSCSLMNDDKEVIWPEKALVCNSEIFADDVKKFEDNKANLDEGDGDDRSDTSEVATMGTRSGIEDRKEQNSPVKVKFDVSARSVRRPRTLQDYDTVKPLRKIGPAEFISPWSDDLDIAGIEIKEKGKRRKPQNTTKTRSFNVFGGDLGNNRISQSQDGENNLDPDIKITDSATVTSESVESDDSCSIYSVRTNATTSSGFSKILRR